MLRLKVKPNPYGIHPKEIESGNSSHATIDNDGRPCCVVMRPVYESPNSMSFIGATFDPVNTYKTGEATELRAASQKTAYLYLGVSTDDPEFNSKLEKAEPVEVNGEDDYYRQKLRNGVLIPCCIFSEKLAGYKAPEGVFSKLDALAEKVFDRGVDEFSLKYADLALARAKPAEKKKSKNAVAPTT